MQSKEHASINIFGMLDQNLIQVNFTIVRSLITIFKTQIRALSVQRFGLMRKITGNVILDTSV